VAKVTSSDAKGAVFELRYGSANPSTKVKGAGAGENQGERKKAKTDQGQQLTVLQYDWIAHVDKIDPRKSEWQKRHEKNHDKELLKNRLAF